MPSVADFLIERMKHSGIKHIFGMPGSYISNFLKKSSASDVEVVHTTREENASFAADAYARLRGAGCVCVSQTGVLKIANAISCAHTDRSPVIVICGSPPSRAASSVYYRKIFDCITCSSVVLDNPTTAGYKIDLAFEMLKYHKQPIFLELLQDIADKPVVYDVYKHGTPSIPADDPEILSEAMEEVVDWINMAKTPVILAGVQLARYGLGNDLLKFAEKFNIPIISTLLSKSVINEIHPLFLGVYTGDSSAPRVKKAIDESDCLLMLGTSNPKKRKSICCSAECVSVKNHCYNAIGFENFVRSLFKSNIMREGLALDIIVHKSKEFKPRNGTKVSSARFFEKINSVLNAELSVVSDVGDTLLGASELEIHRQSHFVATDVQPSMGFAIPAALGVQSAFPKIRPIVVVGDGAFQMSCNELSTIVSRRLNPIICVLNNGGYASGGEFNDIYEWDYDKVVEMIGGRGYVIEDEQGLHSIISQVLTQDSMSVINIKIDGDNK